MEAILKDQPPASTGKKWIFSLNYTSVKEIKCESDLI